MSALSEKEKAYLNGLMNNEKVVSLSKGEIIGGKVKIIEGLQMADTSVRL